MQIIKKHPPSAIFAMALQFSSWLHPFLAFYDCQFVLEAEITLGMLAKNNSK